MEIIAQSKFLRVSPRKLRLVAAALKGLSAKQAQLLLEQTEKRAAFPLGKVVKSAIANAVRVKNVPLESLKVKKVEVNGGPIYKRFQPVSRGQAHSIKKRTSHLRIVLEGGQ